MISALRICPKCGWGIPADAPEGGCPGCLLESGLRLLEEEDDLGPDSPAPIDARFGIYEIERRPDGMVRRGRHTFKRVNALLYQVHSWKLSFGWRNEGEFVFSVISVSSVAVRL